MKKILQKPNLSGRLVNGLVELGQFDIEFHPRTSIKGQVLADFLLEFGNTPESEELPKKETWVAYVDGSSANRKSGVGVTLASSDGKISNMQSSWTLLPPTMKRSMGSCWPGSL
jgi:Tfp pilus assembly protein PilZ